MKLTLSEQLFQKAKTVSPGGVHSPVRGFKSVGGTPRFIDHAKGAHLTDVDGNTYLDFCMSWGPLIFGHQDPETHDAIQGALSKGWSYGAAERVSLELAELMVQNLPWVKKVRFVNSGTEAVMSALRIARAYTNKNLILKFNGCYHGHVDSLLVKAGSGLADLALPDSAGISKQTAAETLVAELGDLNQLNEIFEKQGNNLAAVIIEPLPANNGLLIQTPEYLKNLSELCKKHAVLLIFDEVISGFRVGFGGMTQQTRITPDLVTYGKIIGGGFPVGAYGGRADLMDLVAPVGPVYQAGTLSANPVSMTAGLTTLKKLLRENPYPKLEKQTRFISSEIQKKLQSEVPHVSSIFWIKLKDNYSALFHALLEGGVYLAPSACEVSFLSTAHTDVVIDQFLDRFHRAYDQTLRKGGLV